MTRTTRLLIAVAVRTLTLAGCAGGHGDAKPAEAVIQADDSPAFNQPGSGLMLATEWDWMLSKSF